ncbi:transporter substrate-binding domain-containing protein [Vibrio brasiliensis]|uniref:substrate-binding periplasmic protein n=1 Tax=Vibrio brasiliensis TaxID=170652 RepID=UPI001EFEE16A|nr:transporter substrate-binding domain-containing protein [Vibrio brasiliensis]MCG9749814.1 transporter substrate-binding domain-containing protein [Vibrio brasiliensis]
MGRLQVLASALLLSISAHAEEKLVRFAIGEWPPYTSASNRPEQTVTQQIVVEAFVSQGYQVKLDYFPWSRAYKLASEGKYDGSFPWIQNSQRDELFLYSDAIFTQTVVFFYHQDSEFSWRQIKDLNQYIIGGTQDYQTVFFLDQYGIEQTISIDEETSFSKLIKKRIDAYPTGRIRGQYLIDNTLSRDEAKLIQTDPKPLFEDDMHILFPKQNNERSKMLIDVFAKGLEELIDSGRYQEIMIDNNRID